jgi:hypothetical protein
MPSREPRIERSLLGDNRIKIDRRLKEVEEEL